MKALGNRKLVHNPKNMRYVLFFLLFFVLSCSSSGDSSEYTDQAENEVSYPAVTANTQSNNATRPARFNQEPQPDKKLIRTANLRIEVSDYNKSRLDVHELVQNHQGFLVHDEEKRFLYKAENSLIIRIPPEQLDLFVEGLVKVAKKVDQKTISTKDVSDRYLDLEIRIASKKAVIERYQQLILQANKVEDILKIEEKLRVIIEEIEVKEGQLRQLKDKIQYSTVHLTLYQPQEPPVEVSDTFGGRMIRSFRSGWDGLLELLIGLASIWPFVLLGIVAWVVIRQNRRQKRQLDRID